MEVRYFPYRPEAWRFKTISEFKNSVNRGAEINFEWNGREYHICPVWPNGEVRHCITLLDTRQDTVYQNAEDMLEYMIDDTRLRDWIFADSFMTLGPAHDTPSCMIQVGICVRIYHFC